MGGNPPIGGPKHCLLKAHNADPGNVCMCLLNEPQMKHSLWGGLPPPPRIVLASGVANGAFQCHFGSLYSNNPIPSRTILSWDLHWSQECLCHWLFTGGSIACLSWSGVGCPQNPQYGDPLWVRDLFWASRALARNPNVMTRSRGTTPPFLSY